MNTHGVQMKSFRIILSMAALAGLLSVAVTTSATDYSWTNNAGGTYSDAGNWDPGGGPPAVGDNASFGLAGSYQVDFTGAAASSNVVVESSNAVTFDLQGNTYTIGTGLDGPLLITNTASLVISSSSGGGTVVANGSVGGFNNAFFIDSGASLRVDDSLGSPVIFDTKRGATINGTLTIDGAGTRHVNSVAGVFYYINGTMNVTGGATAIVNNVTHTGGGSSSIVVDGAESVLSVNGGSRIGQFGGNVTLSGGGTYNTTTTFEMGVSSGSTLVNVGDGIGVSTLKAGLVLFATTVDPNRGFSELRINTGGLVEAGSASTNAFFIYDRGTATMAGGTLSLTNGAGVQIADINNDNNQEGVLRGFGTINRLGTTGTFTIYNNGDLRPGDTNATARIGTLSVFDGDLVQYSGGTTHYQFDAANLADLISMSNGIATLGGTNVFSTVAGFTPGLQDFNTWEFLRADQISYNASDNIDALMAGFGFAPDGYFFGVIQDGPQQVLILQIPEPSAALLLLAGLVLLKKKR